MSDSEVKTSETKTSSARKPRTDKAAAPAAAVSDAPKVRKPRVKKEAAATAAPAEAKAPAKPRKAAAKKTARQKVTPEQRHEMVCTAAYFIAEKRGFMHGYDHDDWLAAEVQVDATIELI